MKRDLSSRQMINAELAAREGNKKSLKILKHHIPKAEQPGLEILFNCECSDLNCQERISLTLDGYEKLHRNHARFVIVKGHIEPKVEQAKATSKNLAVVEKYAL